MRTRSIGSLVVAALVALTVMWRLTLALGAVPNRTSVTFDAARRAMLNVHAADALRSGDLPGVLRYLAGPETWPTFRLAVAAPLHVLFGPANALAVEEGLSIAFVGALLLLLFLAARQIAQDRLAETALFLLAAAVLLGNRPLLEHAADGMLEVPSALMTLAATTAWLRTRDRGLQRPWLLAVAGNLLFHVKWQHGMIFAALVLGTELCESGPRRALRAFGMALGRGLRRASSAAGALAALVLLGTAAWVASTGGTRFSLFGVKISMQTVQGPVAFGMLALLGYVQRALWLDRERLRAAIPERVRFLWCWLATPMAAWLLVPFTWRLRVLTATSFQYDSGRAPAGLAERLLFYPHAVGSTWFVGWGPALVLVLCVASVIAAWRSPRVRRLVVPFGVVGLGELVLLTALSRRNFQPRFLLNVAPLLALFAAAWIAALRPTLLRGALALVATVGVGATVVPAWAPRPLAATLARGFEQPEVGQDCERLARTLSLTGGTVVNRTSAKRKEACAMWAVFVARERGGQVAVAGLDHPRGDEVLLIEDGSQPAPLMGGLTPVGEITRVGPLTARRFHLGKKAALRLVGASSP